MNTILIAVDGPAGAGKSTISKRVAKKLGITYIDTGALYRALTLKILNSNIENDNIEEIVKIINKTDISFQDNHILLDGQIVDDDIRKNEVSNNVSNIAKIKEVREKLGQIQRNIAKKQSSILDGRDIGTVVLPNADFKFYITANPEERGNRRYKELLENGDNKISLNQVIEDIKKRDQIDSNREIAPLKKSEDAFEIDNTDLNIEESVDKIISIIMENKHVI